MGFSDSVASIRGPRCLGSRVCRGVEPNLRQSAKHMFRAIIREQNVLRGKGSSCAATMTVKHGEEARVGVAVDGAQL